MTDYTPPMSRLRDEYVDMRRKQYGFTDLYAAEFDRALEECLRQAEEAAWAEGYHDGVMDEFRGEAETTQNPYEKEDADV